MIGIHFESQDQKSESCFYNLMFLSTVDIIQQVLRGMKKKSFGRILTITSITVKQPVDNLISSNAVRTSLLGLIRSLSNEVGAYGITVNNLLPEYTNTNRLQQLVEKNPKYGRIYIYGRPGVYYLTDL